MNYAGFYSLEHAYVRLTRLEPSDIVERFLLFRQFIARYGSRRSTRVAVPKTRGTVTLRIVVACTPRGADSGHGSVAG
jgi:hypothetical protein